MQDTVSKLTNQISSHRITVFNQLLRIKANRNQMKYKIICFLFAFASIIFSVEGNLEAERIARHIEIRRELEREATPFLYESPNLEIPKTDPGSPGRPRTVAIVTSWLEYFGTCSVIDLVAGIFSTLSLVMGGGYLLWKMNPFLGKNIK